MYNNFLMIDDFVLLIKFFSSYFVLLNFELLRILSKLIDKLFELIKII